MKGSIVCPEIQGWRILRHLADPQEMSCPWGGTLIPIDRARGKSFQKADYRLQQGCERLSFARWLRHTQAILPIPDLEYSMQGHSQVIDNLNMLLAGELTAIDQYFAHSHMYRDWGLNKLADHIEHETLEERDHADRLAQRILFLEGQPDLAKRDPLNVGHSVPEMLRNDLAVELRVIANLRKVMALCESLQDYETRNILQKLLDDTEMDHTWWLERQLRLIDSLGLQNYLQSQMESENTA